MSFHSYVAMLVYQSVSPFSLGDSIFQYLSHTKCCREHFWHFWWFDVGSPASRGKMSDTLPPQKLAISRILRLTLLMTPLTTCPQESETGRGWHVPGPLGLLGTVGSQDLRLGLWSYVIVMTCYDLIWLMVWNHGLLWLSIQLGIVIPNWRTHIFQRGRYTTNQLWLMTHMTICWICSDSSIPDGLIKVDHIKPPPPHALPTEIGDFRLAGQKPNEPREFAEFGGPKKMEQSSGGCCWWYAFCYIFHTTISGKCCGFVIHVGIVEILEGYSWSAHQCSGIFGAQAFERKVQKLRWSTSSFHTDIHRTYVGLLTPWSMFAIYIYIYIQYISWNLQWVAM